VPLQHRHSPLESRELDDATNAAKLIAAFALRLGTAGFEPLRRLNPAEGLAILE